MTIRACYRPVSYTHLDVYKRQAQVPVKIITFFIEAFAAGPLYAAFPVGAMLLRKGASIKNVMIFTGTWAACKVPMLLIEVSSLGAKFTIVRLVVEDVYKRQG